MTSGYDYPDIPNSAIRPPGRKGGISGLIFPDSFAQEESDIDIVNISEDFKRKNILKRADMTKDAEIRTIRKFMVPLDIITMTPEEYGNKTSLKAE